MHKVLYKSLKAVFQYMRVNRMGAVELINEI